MPAMPVTPRTPDIARGSTPIVVGVDGSEASLAALRWAAQEAAAHHAPLIALYVIDPRGRRFASYAGLGLRAGRATGPASEAAMMDDAALVERAIADTGVPHVKRIFEVGVPSQALVRAAIGARMLVLGHADHHRRRDGDLPAQGPALGVIARACVARATCPVVVVPMPSRPPAARPALPEPQHVPQTRQEPLAGSRTVFPRHQPVPIAHG